MRVISPAEYRPMPWKNGGGVTSEIYVDPPSGAFDWRVSIVSVNADGAFSTFSGYERHIMVLTGKGMALDIAGRGTFNLEPLRPFTFSGDDTVHGALSHGAVRDFNLMVRRDFGRGTLRVSSFDAGAIMGSGMSLCLAYVLEGGCMLDGQPLESGSSVFLGRGEFFNLPAALKLAICEITTHPLPVPNA